MTTMTDTAPLAITEPELVTLLAMGEGPGVTLSGQALGLGPLLAENLTHRAGVQTLLVRGLAELDGRELRAVAQARAVAAIAAAATEAFVVTVEGPATKTITSLISADGARMMFTLYPTGVHEVRLLTPEKSALDLVEAFLLAYDSDPAPERPLVARIRRLTAAGEHGVRLEWPTAGHWVYAPSILGTQSGAPGAVWPAVAAALAG